MQPASHSQGVKIMGEKYAIEWLYKAAKEVLEANGGNPPDWMQEEAEELENALFYFDAHGPKQEA
jgi:hypothetical protein